MLKCSNYDGYGVPTKSRLQLICSLDRLLLLHVLCAICIGPSPKKHLKVLPGRKGQRAVCAFCTPLENSSPTVVGGEASSHFVSYLLRGLIVDFPIVKKRSVINIALIEHNQSRVHKLT